MKIYEIGTGYTPIPAQVAAATESVVEELTKSFIKKGQPVQIIDISTEKRAPHELPITEVKVPRFFTKSDVSLGIVHKLKRVVYSLALASKLKKILKKEEEPIVLHFHNQYNLFFFLKTVSKKKRAKALIAYTNHNGLWSLPWEDTKSILQKRYFQEIEAMKKADVVFVLNRDMKNNVSNALGIPQDKVIQIDNGVNTSLYAPLDENEILNLKSKFELTGKKVIMQVGSVYENKGQGRAIQLLAPLLIQNSDLVYAYVGGIVSQEYFDEVKQTAEELGVKDQVRYLGAVSPGAEMNAFYNLADMTIFLSKYEGFPLVCIESLSAGIPVLICSDNLLDFGEGCVKCSADTAEDIIADYITHAEKISDIKRKARENAILNYTWDKIAGDYLKQFSR